MSIQHPDVLPRVLNWIEDDAAALSRLVDVLKSSSDTVQASLVAQMKDAGSSSTVLLVLARLQSVDAFKTWWILFFVMRMVYCLQRMEFET